MCFNVFGKEIIFPRNWLTTCRPRSRWRTSSCIKGSTRRNTNGYLRVTFEKVEGPVYERIEDGRHERKGGRNSWLLNKKRESAEVGSNETESWWEWNETVVFVGNGSSSKRNVLGYTYVHDIIVIILDPEVDGLSVIWI